MSRDVLSFQNYSPSMVDAAIAYRLPPQFVVTLEGLVKTMRSTVATICQDSVVYDTPADIKKMAMHLNFVLERYFNRHHEAAFWMQLDTTSEYYKIRLDTELLKQASQKNAWILRRDFVAREPQTEKFLNGLVHLGHAGVFIDETAKILVDPVFYEFHDEPGIAPIHGGSFEKIDAIFFTHFHGDHFDLETLVQLKREIPIYVPRFLGRPLEPDMRCLLTNMGFTTVKEVEVGERIQFAADTFVDILPFYGEGRELVGFEAYCPLYSGLGRRVLFHADSGPNHQNRSLLDAPELAKTLAEDGPIDTVFGSWWQGRSFLLNLAPSVLVSGEFSTLDWLRSTENCDCNTEYLTRLIRELGAKRFITYAEGGADRFYPPERQSHGVANYAFFWRQLQDIARELEKNTGVRLEEANPRQSF